MHFDLLLMIIVHEAGLPGRHLKNQLVAFYHCTETLKRSETHLQTCNLFTSVVEGPWWTDFQDVQCASFGICGIWKNIKSLRRSFILGITLVIYPMQQNFSRFYETAEVINVTISIAVTCHKAKFFYQSSGSLIYHPCENCTDDFSFYTFKQSKMSPFSHIISNPLIIMFLANWRNSSCV